MKDIAGLLPAKLPLTHYSDYGGSCDPRHNRRHFLAVRFGLSRDAQQDVDCGYVAIIP